MNAETKKQPIKLTQEEISEFKLLREKLLGLIYEFGNLSVEKMELDKLVDNWTDKKEKLTTEWTQTQSMENSFVSKISNKYGNGNLNPETNEFYPE